MTIADIINTIGVSLILLAFLLLTLKKVSSESKSYHLINLIGAGLACYGSYLINAVPFIVLEGIWCMVAVYGLFKKSTL